MQRSKRQYIFVGTLMLSALMFLVPLNLSAQNVNIPDANLREAINEALGKEPNARITKDEMERLTYLDASAKDIKNLRGLEAATRLDGLDLNNNRITNLSPLAGLVRLHHIGLEENAISDISALENLINLEGLHISHNLISDISPLEGLINLRRLNIGDNLVSDWSPLAGLIKLDHITMSHNPAADLSPLAELSSLRRFHTWGTPILDLAPLAKSPKMEEISICGGDISDISSLEGMTSLKQLYLPGNDVSDISVLASLTGLTRLSLEHNDVSDLSPLEKLSGLTWVDLRDNAISDVSPLSELSSLTWLDLSQNRITDVSSLAFLPSLAWMGLTQNPIADTSSLERFSTKTAITHSDFVNTAFPDAGPKIEGPWLWVIVPGVRVGNADLLARASGGAATEAKVATFGAKEDKAVGSSVWKAHKLSPVGGDNLNEMTDALGWGSGSDIYDHVVYGSVTLESPRKQETTMLVGSDDEVKVWINGEVVHYNPVQRGAGDYRDAFPVTLKKGTNVLLVAVSNGGHGSFSGFFGFAKNTKYTLNAPGDPIEIKLPGWDVNQDAVVNILDLILVARDMGKTDAADSRTDVNGDGKRNILDLTAVARRLGEAPGAAAPSAITIDSDVSPEMVRTWIAHAQAASDGSLVFQQGIANLRQLLASLIPERTALLMNYPNPFNPETWIPYQLAGPAAVTLRIYEINGALVRTLDLGHQSEGRYHDRSRAAYWDGKNEVGESVASGIYFYTLTAGDFTGTGKMLIRK